MIIEFNDKTRKINVIWIGIERDVTNDFAMKLSDRLDLTAKIHYI